MIWATAPAYLWLLAAAVVPVLLFLLRRRRLRVVRFPPARFLAEAALVRTRVMKFLELLVLAMRILLVVLAALILSEIMIEPRGVLGRLFRPEERTVAAVVDDTPSMTRPAAAAENTLLQSALGMADELKTAGLVSTVESLSGAGETDAGFRRARSLSEVLHFEEPYSTVVLFTDGALSVTDLLPLPPGTRMMKITALEPSSGCIDVGIDRVETDEPYPVRGAQVGLRIFTRSTAATKATLILSEKGKGAAADGTLEPLLSAPMQIPEGLADTEVTMPPSTQAPGLYVVEVDAGADRYAVNNRMVVALNRFPPRRVAVAASDQENSCIRKIFTPTGRPALDGVFLEQVPIEGGRAALPSPGEEEKILVAAIGGEGLHGVSGWWADYCTSGGSVLIWGNRLPSGLGDTRLGPVEGIVSHAGGMSFGRCRSTVADVVPPAAEVLFRIDTKERNWPAAFSLRTGLGKLGWCGLDTTELASTPWAAAAAGMLLDALECSPEGILIVEDGNTVRLPVGSPGAVVRTGEGREIPLRTGIFSAVGVTPGIYYIVGLHGRLREYALTVVSAAGERFPPYTAEEPVRKLAEELRDMLGIPVEVITDRETLNRSVAAAAGLRSLSGLLITAFMLVFVMEALLSNLLAGRRQENNAPGTGRMAL